jgi:hypothetical protein
MTISAKVAGTELQDGMNSRFGGAYFEAVLLDAAGVSYNPANDDAQNATFLTTYEVAATGGYSRQVIGWAADSAGAYTDDGVAMDQRNIVFEHDGSGNNIVFTHMALVWGSGNISAGGVATTAPGGALDGTYVNIPTTSSGSGVGATVDIVVSSSGATAGDYAVTINSPGTGYAASETLTIQNADMVSAGMDPGTADPLTFVVPSVYTSTEAGKIFSVAQVDGQVTIANGNSAAFYVNLKEFGFYSV